MPTSVMELPTFVYRGQRFFWGYSPDRQTCGFWEVSDPTGPPHRTWPISEHEAAWREFRSAEPYAEEYTELPPPPKAPSTDLSGLFLTEDEDGPDAFVTVEPVGNGGANGIEHPNGAGRPHDVDEAIDDFQLATDSRPSEAASDVVVGAVGAVAPRTRWKRLGLIVALSVVVVVGALFGLKALRPKPATIDPSQVVLTAASTLQAHHSAHLSMTETISGVKGAGTITVPASGQIDFADNAASLTMAVSGEQISVVSSQGTMYMSVPQIEQLVPGKSWVSVPEDSSGSAAGGALSGGDPSQMLRYLASEGNTVSSIGSSTVDGMPVQGYSVMINKSAVDAELARSGLSPSLVQSAESFLDSAGALNFRVYVTASNELAQIDFSMAVPGDSGATVSAQMTFSDYDAPVTVSAPPSSEVVSLQQFLYAAEQGAGSPFSS